MNPVYILVGVSGAILIVGGLVVGRTVVAAEQEVDERLGAAPGQRVYSPHVPVHTTAPELERQRQTMLQLLTAYQSDLRKLQSQADVIQMDITRLEGAATAPCEKYAQRPTWRYHCNGFPICSFNEWWSISGTERDGGAFDACRTAVTTGGHLPGPAGHPLRHNDPYNRGALERIHTQNQSGYTQAKNLLGQIQAKRSELAALQPRIAELNKKIADLQAQGVF